jgi:hypothetical protein
VFQTLHLAAVTRLLPQILRGNEALMARAPPKETDAPLTTARHGNLRCPRRCTWGEREKAAAVLFDACQGRVVGRRRAEEAPSASRTDVARLACG